MFSIIGDFLLPRSCMVCQRSHILTPVCTRCTPLSPTMEALRCAVCGSPGESPCQVCVAFPPLHRRVRSLLPYDEKTRRLIVAMKYRPSLRLARWCGALLAEHFQSLFADTEMDWDVAVPMPLSPESLRSRLFNQAAVLARALPLASQDALRVIKRHPAQASLPPTARLSNVRNIFAMKSRGVQGKRVLLVDDVLTTGATAASAARTLMAAGAEYVDLVTLARADSWPSWRAAVHRAFPRPHSVANDYSPHDGSGYSAAHD